jgi:hypothetical protein
MLGLSHDDERKHHHPHEELDTMRPYGLELTLIAGPDVADIQGQARKGSVGHFAGKGGEFRSYTRSTAAKRATRVAIKRGARTAARKAIARELRELG